jgi:hypothetical protein
VGRKSRPKAAHRAERAHVMIQASQGLAGTAWLPPAAGHRPQATAWPVDPRPERPPLTEGDRSAPTEHLQALAKRQRELLEEIEDEVRCLRAEGHSWTVVGRAIGLSRQGARQRYRHVMAEMQKSEAVPTVLRVRPSRVSR